MSILYQGVIVVDPEPIREVNLCADNPVFADQDVNPAILFSLQACIGFVWWVIAMFYYARNIPAASLKS